MGEGKQTATPRAGQAFVELALLLPLVLLLVAGMVELGRAFLALSAVEAAAYRGATFAAFTRVNALDDAAIAAVTRGDWSSLPTSDTNPRVTIARVDETLPRGDGWRYDTVTVSVQYLLAPLMPWPGVPTIPPLRHAVTMRVQP